MLRGLLSIWETPIGECLRKKNQYSPTRGPGADLGSRWGFVGCPFWPPRGVYFGSNNNGRNKGLNYSVTYSFIYVAIRYTYPRTAVWYRVVP